MGEQVFIKFMTDMTKHSNEEYLKKLTDRIFERYCNHEENVIEEEGFKRMAVAFDIGMDDSR